MFPIVKLISCLGSKAESERSIRRIGVDQDRRKVDSFAENAEEIKRTRKSRSYIFTGDI